MPNKLGQDSGAGRSELKESLQLYSPPQEAFHSFGSSQPPPTVRTESSAASVLACHTREQVFLAQSCVTITQGGRGPLQFPKAESFSNSSV